MKKLIPALCMLLVAACLMGTSTYAWFAANETVTASGMSVKAAADGGLGIAAWTSLDNAPVRPALDAYKGTADLTNAWTNQLGITSPTVRPASVNPVGAGTWYTGTSNATNSSAAVAPEGGTKYSVISNGAQYYQASQFSIRSLKEAATAADNIDLKLATITVEGAANTVNLNKSLRVALYVYADPGDNTVPTTGSWYVFAPNSTATAFKHVTSTSEDATSTNVTAGTAPNVTIFDNLTAAPVVVQVYVYYDGMDANCISDYLSINVDTLTVALGFSTKS